MMIPPADLLVMDLAPDAQNHARRVVIQLLPPPFSQGWVGNIRKLAAAHWWDGTSINRAQDGYVVQWGDPDGEDKAKAKPLPAGLAVVPQADYEATTPALPFMWTDHGIQRMPRSVGPILPPLKSDRIADPYASYYAFAGGTPLAVEPKTERVEAGGPAASSRRALEQSTIGRAWPVHCYGSVGVGRDYPPDTGSGAELYAVIGQAPRQLDRNIAVVGKVIEGMEHLSTLPRGTGDLGFYKTAPERTSIRSVRIGTEVPDVAAFEYLGPETTSFARYADARANRSDAFYIQPAGGVDICNLPVPVRRVRP